MNQLKTSQSTVYEWTSLQKVEWTRKEEIRRLEALAVRKPCYVRQCSYSRYKYKWNTTPGINTNGTFHSPGFPPVGAGVGRLNFCVLSTPLVTMSTVKSHLWKRTHCSWVNAPELNIARWASNAGQSDQLFDWSLALLWWIYKWVDGWVNGWMGGWMDGWKGRCVHGCMGS